MTLRRALGALAVAWARSACGGARRGAAARRRPRRRAGQPQRPPPAVRDTIRDRATRCGPRRTRTPRPTRRASRNFLPPDSVMQRLMTLAGLQPHALSGATSSPSRRRRAASALTNRALVERDSQIVKSDTIDVQRRRRRACRRSASATCSSSRARRRRSSRRARRTTTWPRDASPAADVCAPRSRSRARRCSSAASATPPSRVGDSLRNANDVNYYVQEWHRHRVRRLHPRLLLQGEGDQAHGLLRRRAAGDALHRRRAGDVAALRLPGRARRAAQRHPAAERRA